LQKDWKRAVTEFTWKILNYDALSYYVHPTAVIDEGCSIGEGTKIWHFSHVMTGAVIGSNCNLGQNIVVSPNVVLGNNVHVQNNVSIYEGVICEDDVFLGPGAVLTNVINPRSAISRKHEFKTTLIKKGASIGANATIVCGICIYEFGFIGAGAVVTKDVPAYALIIGNPGRQTGWMSEYGHKLEFNENNMAVCPGSGQEYVLEINCVRKR
jgi:UDP-2-acetamido-3-amino-2,3-dideoxy-glucuronate N-acetyltransferase